jgi:hypothetical protein
MKAGIAFQRYRIYWLIARMERTIFSFDQLQYVAAPGIETESSHYKTSLEISCLIIKGIKAKLTRGPNSFLLHIGIMTIVKGINYAGRRTAAFHKIKGKLSLWCSIFCFTSG